MPTIKKIAISKDAWRREVSTATTDRCDCGTTYRDHRDPQSTLGAEHACSIQPARCESRPISKTGDSDHPDARSTWARVPASERIRHHAGNGYVTSTTPRPPSRPSRPRGSQPRGKLASTPEIHELDLVSAPPLKLTGVQRPQRAPALGGLTTRSTSSHGRRSAGSWAPRIELPSNWEFFRVQEWLGIDHFSSGFVDEDPLVPTNNSGFDVDSAPTAFGDILPHCQEYEYDGESLYELFRDWSSATAVPEHGGTPFDCNNMFPCNPFNVADIALDMTRPGRSPLEGGKLPHDPSDECPNVLCDSSESVRLRVGPAQLQWFWLCARLVPADGFEDFGAALIRVTVDDGFQTIYQGNKIITCMGGAPFFCGMLSGRRRQTWPNQSFYITVIRPDVRSVEPNYAEIGPRGRVEVKVLGRLGYVHA